MTDTTKLAENTAALVNEYQKIKAAHEADQAKFNAHWKPALEKLAEIATQIQATMTEQGVKSFKTDTGTAILSTITTPKVLDKEQYLDWVLANWDDYGAMLQIGQPQKDALQEYMDANDNKLPPFVTVENFVRFSIRKA
jgi:hypothetical protein